MKERRKTKLEHKVNEGPWGSPENFLDNNPNYHYSLYPETTWRAFICYQVIYLLGLVFALYNFFLFSQRKKHFLELSVTNSIFGNYEDQNDLEWKIFIPILFEYAPFGILHLILAQVARKFFPSLLKFLYIIFSILMLLKILGTMGTILCFLIPLVMFCTLFSRIRSLIWITWSSILIIFNCKIFQDFIDREMNNNGEGEYKTSVIIAWMLLRCVSFCLVTCDEDPQRMTFPFQLFIDMMAYCFYFPNLITGPYMPYKDFKIGVAKPYKPWNIRRLVWFTLQIGRFILWLWIANTSLYFFYAHALIFSPQFIENINSWTIGGYYSFIFIFFFLKYVVFYGLPSVLARAEGFSPPEHPKCILLVRRYYDIWKHFDIGLHKFIVDHIYLPFMGEDSNFWKQVQGTVIAFTFIYVWHGAYPSILWWCVINFFLTVVEKIFDKVFQTRRYIAWEDKFLPSVAGKVFRLIVAGLILTIAMNSLMIFLASIDHAQHIFRDIFVRGFPVTTIVTVFFFSLMAQAGNDFHNFRMKNKLKKS